MNIFYLDTSPIKSARDMCDKHVIKMILETCQLLSTAHRLIDGDERADRLGLYKKTHENHPSAVWVRQSSRHYLWLYRHLVALCMEYTYRYEKVHASQRLLESLRQVPDGLEDNGFASPPQAMPPEYQGLNAVDAYRRYYKGAKRSFARWRKGEPDWWFDEPFLMWAGI